MSTIEGLTAQESRIMADWIARNRGLPTNPTLLFKEADLMRLVSCRRRVMAGALNENRVKQQFDVVINGAGYMLVYDRPRTWRDGMGDMVLEINAWWMVYGPPLTIGAMSIILAVTIGLAIRVTVGGAW